MTAKVVPILLGISVILIATLPYATSAHAQYIGNDLNVNALDESIKMAHERVVKANENPATGSGTPYFAADGVAGAMGIAAGVFGGVSFAFFAKARKGKYAAQGRG